MKQSIYLMTMGISSNYLEAFMVCAQIGNFTKASERLHITQSALSQRVLNLEEELGVTLFIRERQGARLTDSGEKLLRYCVAKDAIEKETIEDLKRSSSGEISGTIRIGGFSSIMRSFILPALSSILHKNENVRLSFISREMDELPGYLRRGEIDFMVLSTELSHHGFETIDLGVERNVLIEKRGYKGPNVYLDHDENDQVTAKYLKMINLKTQYTRNFMDDVYGLIDGVKNGLGRAVVPRHLVDGDGELKIISDKELKIPIYLHYYSQPYYSKLHALVVKTLKENKM